MRMATVVLFLALASGCGPESRDALRCTSETDTDPILDESFTVRYHDSATIRSEALTLTFAELVSDSRCPAGDACAVGGSANVEITASQTGQEPATLELASRSEGVPPLGQTEATYGGYTIALISVVPYPETGRTIQPTDYCVGLRVSNEQ